MPAAPLIITGMHRSGTSATARLLAQAGLDVGERLMSARLDNALGYYEDLDVVDLDMALVAAGVGADADADPDWAFPDRIVPSRMEALRPRAEAIVAARQARGRPWGLKDPRVAILLPFYDDLLPEARYLFVYRAPWDVLSSLMATSARPLQGRPGVALEAWTAYNERLLDFRARHPGRTTLVHVDAVGDRAAEVLALVASRAHPDAPLGLRAQAARDAFAPSLLRRAGASSALAELVRAHHPETVATFARLEAAADLPGRAPARRATPEALDHTPGTGRVGVAVVLVGGAPDGLDDVVSVTRLAPDASPAQAADVGVNQLPGEFVALLFDGRVRPTALATAVTALGDDAELAAVGLAPGEDEGQAREEDPTDHVDGGGAIVVRRAAWLAVRGFEASAPVPGFEAWAFAVACRARGLRTARIAGGCHPSTGPAGSRDAAWTGVLSRHPALMAERGLAARREATVAAQRADTAEAEHERVAGELAQLRATRAWRLVVRWWAVKAHLRR